MKSFIIYILKLHLMKMKLIERCWHPAVVWSLLQLNANSLPKRTVNYLFLYPKILDVTSSKTILSKSFLNTLLRTFNSTHEAVFIVNVIFEYMDIVNYYHKMDEKKIK